MTQKLTVRRVGGLLPTLRPSRTHALDDLDAATQAAVKDFVAAHTRQGRAAHADATSYVFELAGPKGTQTVSVGFDAIPRALLDLLPGPGPKG